MTSRRRKGLPAAVRTLLFASLLGLVALLHAGIRRVVLEAMLRDRAQEILRTVSSATVDHIGLVTLDADGNIVVRDAAFSLEENGVRRPLWRAGRAVIALDGWPLRDSGLRPARLDLFDAEIHFRRDKTGNWNVKRALQRPPPPPAPPPPSPAPGPGPTSTPPPPAASSPPVRPAFFNGIHVHGSVVHLTLEGASGREVTYTATGVELEVAMEAGSVRIGPVGGDFYGGRLLGEVMLRSLSPLSISAQVTVRGADAGRLAAGFGALPRPVSGRLDGALAVTLDAGTGWKPVAAGRLEVTKGNLYELPAFTGILGLLALDPVADRVVDAAQLLFTVERDFVRIDEMNFLGRPVSLFGDGVMGVTGEDLYVLLVPRLGASWNDIVPLIGAPVQLLLDVVKGELVPVVIRGSFWKPSFEIAPKDKGLSPRVRQLIEEKSRRQG